MANMDQLWDWEITQVNKDPDPSYTWNEIGKRGLVGVDAKEKVQGSAIYTRDVILPGMLYATALISPYPHAEVKSIDSTEAENIPGVIKVLKWDGLEIEEILKSLTSFDDLAQFTGSTLSVLGGVAHHEGQYCGAIVIAETEDSAYEGVRALEVEWEQLPFVLDIDEALEENAPLSNPEHYPESNLMGRTSQEYGNVDEALNDSDKVVSFTLNRPNHTWAGVEAGSAVARILGDKIEVWVHSQRPYESITGLSGTFGVPENMVFGHFPYNGGTFGQGQLPCKMCVPPAVLCAFATKRPVKFMINMCVSGFYGGSQDFCRTDVKVGFNDDGTITSVYADGRTGNSGPGSSESTYYLMRCMNVPNVKNDCTGAWVNAGENGPYRCEGQQPGNIVSLVLNRVAAELDVDPTIVAIKNNGKVGKDMDWILDYAERHGFPRRDSLSECLSAGKELISWDSKWHSAGAKQLENGKMHGLGFTYTHSWHYALGNSGTIVQILKDGSARIFGQIPDIGVSAPTAYCQFVADELGLEYKNVKHWHMDNAGLQMMRPGASCNLTSNTGALRDAAQKARRKLLELATATGEYSNFEYPKFGGLKPEDLTIEKGVIFEINNPENKKLVSEVTVDTLHGTYTFGFPSEWIPADLLKLNPTLAYLQKSPIAAPIIAIGWSRGLGVGLTMSKGTLPVMTRQAHFCEVEVDIETGQIEIKKVVCTNDAGKVISPEACEGSQYGGAYMGLSRTLMEEVIFDQASGVKLNDNLSDYKWTTMNDIDEIDTALIETGLGWGPYGTEGIHESCATITPGLLAPAVYNAIGKWIYDWPITPDKVLKALGKA